MGAALMDYRSLRDCSLRFETSQSVRDTLQRARETSQRIRWCQIKLMAAFCGTVLTV